MTSKFHFHKAIAFFINIFIVSTLIYFVVNDSSDKSPVIFMVFYPLLTIINLIISLVLWYFKMQQLHIYKQTTMALFVLMLPLIFIIIEV